jgi:ubiquinone/menaquinone biosynthesis C-methylase UbiE
MIDMTSFLACPKCRGNLTRAGGFLACANCARQYPIIDDIPQFDPPTSNGSADGGRDVRRDYWDNGWKARIQGDHAFQVELRTRSDWSAYLEREIRVLGESRHVMVVEANRAAVNDKVVLDIGCGSGTSGALFSYLGAHYIGVDHSRHAAAHALRNLRGVGGDGFTAQGNAEALPMRDGSVDVVYSNGVLHHTPNFLTAMDEAYRVLKPGGKAIIALYATYSTQFAVLRLLGVLKGHITRRAQVRWMGEASEGAWRTGDRPNPWTQTFSETQLREVMRKYSLRKLIIRKHGRPIGELPRVGARLMHLRPIRALDRLLEPTFGSMLVMSFDKDLGAASKSAAR